MPHKVNEAASEAVRSSRPRRGTGSWRGEKGRDTLATDVTGDGRFVAHVVAIYPGTSAVDGDTGRGDRAGSFSYPDATSSYAV